MVEMGFTLWYMIDAFYDTASGRYDHFVREIGDVDLGREFLVPEHG